MSSCGHANATDLTDVPTARTPPSPPASSKHEEAPPRSFPLNFTVPITELTIGDGYAEGYYRDWVGAIRYRIHNPYLRKEFHPIRSFFARQLRRKTVDVTAQLAFDAAGEPEIRTARDVSPII